MESNKDKTTGIVRERISEIARSRGVELIEFSLFMSKGGVVVKAIIDYPQGGVDVEACAAVNREIVDYYRTK